MTSPDAFGCIAAGIAAEKIEMMRTFGAEVILTPPAKFTDPEHYFHRAARVAYEGARTAQQATKRRRSAIRSARLEWHIDTGWRSEH